MRDLPAPMLEGIDAHMPYAVYLVEVLLSSPLYWTTGEADDWNGHTWIPAGLVIDDINETSARLELRNDDNTGSALVLNNTLRDTEFRIYLWYNGDAVEIFRGYGSDSAVQKMSVTIELLKDRAGNDRVPRKRMTGPVFTHLPKVGEVIKWGADSYKVTT